MSLRIVAALLFGGACLGWSDSASPAPVDDGKPCPTAQECLARLRHIKDELSTEQRMAGMTLDSVARGLASRALFLGGKSVHAPLAKLLAVKNDSVARAVAAVLGAAGPEAKPVFSALARELNIERRTLRGHETNAEIPRALANIDEARAIPLLEAACRRGNVTAARVLLEVKPEAFQTLLSSPSAGQAADMVISDAHFLSPYLDGEKRLPYLQAARRNPNLPAAARTSIAEALAQASKPITERPKHELDEIDRMLADTEWQPSDEGSFEDGFRAVARAHRAAAPLIPRLVALQKQPLVAARATWALGEIPEPATRAALQETLADQGNWRLPLIAANALGRQGAAAQGAMQALTRLAKTHWHPAVRAMATTAADVIAGKGPAPEALDNADERSTLGHWRYWGQSGEELGMGFRCRAPAAWGKVAAAATCPLPGEVGKTTSCVLVHHLDRAWLRVQPHDKYAGWGVGELPKLKLELWPERSETRAAVVVLEEGYVMGVTGRGTRAVAVVSEHWKISNQEGRGPGRTWLDVFDKHGERWTAQAHIELPAGLATVGRLPDGGLQLGFPNSRLVLRVTPDGQIVPGDCVPDPLAGPYPWAAVLQAVLDDPAFAARLQAAGAELPLHASFGFSPPSGLDRLRFAGRPVVIDTDRRTIAAGRTIDVWGGGRESQRGEESWISEPTDVLTLTLSYAALQIETELRLAQQGGTWKVLPPESPKAAGDHGPVKVVPPPSELKAPRDALTTESGIAFKVTEAAGKELYDGQSPIPGAAVTLDVTAWTADGKLYFPQTRTAPARVEIPPALAVGGLAEAIAMMKTSEARRLWLPAGVAFAAPAADRQDLVLDVRLVAIQAERDDERDLLLEDEMDALERAKRAPKDLARPPKAAKTTPSGLTYRALKQGKRAATPVAAETVSLTFKAWSQDGRLFASGSVGDATWGHDTNHGAPLALLIPGLAEGIRLMPPDSEYRFWIPARLAWGERPRAADVPAGPIVVDVRIDRQ